MPPDRFWGDPACTQHTFDNFSDFRFLHFLHWFSFKSAQKAPFGFRRSLQQSGGHPDPSIHPAAIIPQEVRIFEISCFSEPGKNPKNPGNLQEKGPTRYCGVLKDPPPPWWTCRLLRTHLVSAFFVTDVRHAFVAVHILLEWEISRKSSGKSYLTVVLGVRIQPRTL